MVAFFHTAEDISEPFSFSFAALLLVVFTLGFFRQVWA